MKGLSRAIAAAAVFGAAGCTNLIGGSLGGTFTAENWLNSEVGGSGFNGALAREYQQLAALNANSDVNWLDATVYRGKSEAAEAGSPMPLFMPSDYGVNGELEALRADVIAAAGDHASGRPEECAEMYAMYDRLVETAYQSPGLDRVAARAQFDSAYTSCVGVSDMVVYFGFNRADLTAAADAVIQDIVGGIGSTDAVSVVGHTDTVGGLAFNQRLSERRANTVANRMVDLGVSSAQITTAGRSWTEPAVETGPNVREPLNRRVEISVSP